MDWNPNAPDVIGNEFAARNQPGVPSHPSITVGAAATGIAQRMPSTATETITDLAAFVAGASQSYAFLAEIINAGSEIPANLNTSIFRPNGSTNVDAKWVSTEGTFEDGVNGAVFDPDVYVGISTADPAAAGTHYFDLEFPTGTAISGKRILNVRVCAIVGNNNLATTGTPKLSASVAGFDKTRVWFTYLSPNTQDLSNTASLVGSSGEIEPVTRQPWQVSQFQQMDSTYRARFTAVMPPNPSGLDAARINIYQVWVEVDYCDENRKTAQVVSATNITPGWVTWNPRTPTGGTTWAKVSGTDFTMILRQPRYGTIGIPVGTGLLFSAPYLRGFRAVPPVGLALTPAAPLAASGAVNGIGTVVDTDAIGVLVADPAQSVDTQPYVVTDEVEVAGTVQQEVSGASAQSYTGAVLPLYYTASPDPLLVELRRRSDDTLMASGTISTDEWDESPVDTVFDTWKLMQVDFAVPVTLAAATQYYVALSSSGTGSWWCQALSAWTAGGEGTYGDETDIGTYDGGEHSDADISVLVIIPIDPLTGVTGEQVGCD